MPRQVREVRTARPAASQRTVFGRPWPLPISPVAVGLVAALLVVIAAAWAFEGRFETTPAQAARNLAPYKVEDLQRVELVTEAGRQAFSRDSNGKLSPGGVAPTPSPTPAPEATPAPVSLPPSTRLEGLVGQLATLQIDRVLLNEPSTSADYGLDKPRLTVIMTPKNGPPSALAVGQLNPDDTAYYVRREARGDTVLASRYTLDDLIKVADELIGPPPAPPG
jgi:hypothetical protein